jgi:hypothetical protein
MCQGTGGSHTRLDNLGPFFRLSPSGLGRTAGAEAIALRPAKISFDASGSKIRSKSQRRDDRLLRRQPLE